MGAKFVSTLFIEESYGTASGGVRGGERREAHGSISLAAPYNRGEPRPFSVLLGASRLYPRAKSPTREVVIGCREKQHDLCTADSAKLFLKPCTHFTCELVSIICAAYNDVSAEYYGGSSNTAAVTQEAMYQL